MGNIALKPIAMQRLNPERDRELYRAFKVAFSSHDVQNFQQAIRSAINSPCSQFYVSAEEAYRFINLKKRGRGLVITHWRNGKTPISKHKLHAFKLIYEKYLELSQHRAFQGCSTMFISSFACASPAPCFFISYGRAREIIRQMRKYGKVNRRRTYGKERREDTIEP